MTITVVNRQNGVEIDLRRLQKLARRALAEVFRNPVEHGAVLPELETIEVTIISDKVIARVHEEFMQIPGPTDVITFAHGEILISADSAQKHATHYDHPLPHELGLYVIHGLLHLRGYDDQKPEEAARMHCVQAEILQQVLA